ncbi:MAG: hypothetical protein WAN14_22480, partial [Candidatus Acidiferrales bacterium]
CCVVLTLVAGQENATVFRVACPLVHYSGLTDSRRAEAREWPKICSTQRVRPIADPAVLMRLLSMKCLRDEKRQVAMAEIVELERRRCGN